MGAIHPLPPSELYHPCDLRGLGFETSDQLEPLVESLGQERAVEAIRLGIGMPHPGFNLFLMGSAGIGKHQLILELLRRHSQGLPPPADWCYVAQFGDHHRPIALRLPAGMGGALRADMQQLVEDLLTAIPAAFQSEDYNQRTEAINRKIKEREEAAAGEIGRKANEQGVALVHTPHGYTLLPVREGHILDPEEFGKLPTEEQARIEKLVEELREDLRKTLGQVPLWQKELRRRLKELNSEVTETTVSQLIAELEDKYQSLPEVLAYLAAVKSDVVENADQFRPGEGEDSRSPSPDAPQFTRYRVNLLVDNAGLRGAPVVYEDNPSYLNLVGRIEHIARHGTLLTDFTLIKPGALHRANGGFLVLDALKLLTTPFSWEAVQRVLRSREVRIEPLERLLSLAGTVSLEPQAIPLSLKLILVGDRTLYCLLKAYDPDFGQLFKVAADFAETLERAPDQDQHYARLIATLARDQGLRPLTRAAVERVIEGAARRAADGERLSLHLGSLLDLLQEADYRANQEGAPLVDLAQIQGALDAQRHRLHQETLRGTLLIDTHGVQLGRVNAISVVDLGDTAFGIPTRISATARLGSGEVVDIQREVDQAGPIHAKGVLILSAYLGRRYAKLQPLCLSASLVFEQTYSSVEGDSASLAELCALLSAVGDVPLKQSLAVTGSVNQHGEVQPVGGVNEKIEGFFDLCRDRGLTGAEGVVIPEANRKHLMLKAAVIEAAAAGSFHIYGVRHVDQAMELLTGEPAGVPDAAGNYPLDSVNGQVQYRLAEFFSVRQQIAGAGKAEV